MSSPAQLASPSAKTPEQLIPDDQSFLERLQRHLQEQGTHDPNNWRVPVIQGEPLNLAAFYREVARRGGYAVVDEKKLWKAVGGDIGADVSGTSIGHQLKSSYQKFLLSYELRQQGSVKPLSLAALDKAAGVAAPASDAAPAAASAAPSAPPAAPGQQPSVGRGASAAPALLGAAAGGPGAPSCAPPSTAPPPAAPLGSTNASQAAGIRRPASAAAAALQSAVKRARSGSPAAGPAAQGQLLQVHQAAAAAAARQADDRKQHNSLAICMLERLAPSPGPALSLPPGFKASQEASLEAALRSGLPGAVSWALNAIGLLSFAPPPDCQLLQPLDALLQVLQWGLQPGLPEAWQALPQPPGQAAEAKHQAARWQPVPGAPQGWWWEAEEGLLAPSGAGGAGLTWASAAAACLRNLALQRDHLPALAALPALPAALAACLDLRRRRPGPDTNELTDSALDALRQLAPRLPLRGLPPDGGQQLLSQLAALLPRAAAPLRLQTVAARTVQGLASQACNADALGEALDSAKLRLAGGLVDLAATRLPDARDAAEADAAGECGAPASAEALGLDLPLDLSVLEATALMLHADAVAAAAQALAELVRIPNERTRASLAEAPRLLATLVAVLLDPPAVQAASRQRAATPGSSHQQSYAIPDHVREYVQRTAAGAQRAAAQSLMQLAGVPAARPRLRAHEERLVQAALSAPAAPGQPDYVSPLLHTLARLA